MDFRINILTDFSKCTHYYYRNDSIKDRTVFLWHIGPIFIVKYSVLFGLFNFGLGFGLLNLASASTSASSVWPRLTSLEVSAE